MKIDVENKNAYEEVTKVIESWCEDRGYYSDFIVWIKTSLGGETKDYLSWEGFSEGTYPGKFTFDHDWYEGGEVDLLGFCPLDEVEVPEVFLCE